MNVYYNILCQVVLRPINYITGFFCQSAARHIPDEVLDHGSGCLRGTLYRPIQVRPPLQGYIVK